MQSMKINKSRPVLLGSLLLLLVWIGVNLDLHQESQSLMISSNKATTTTTKATITSTKLLNYGTSKTKVHEPSMNMNNEAWTNEEVYVDESIRILGLEVLKRIRSEAERNKVLTLEKNCRESSCTLAPYWIEPNCIIMCKTKGKKAKGLCWSCQHWAVKIKDSVKSSSPSFKLSPQTSIIFLLPVLNHVVRLAILLFQGKKKITCGAIQ